MKNKTKNKAHKIEWYRLKSNEALSMLNSSEIGLSNKEAEKRLKKFGRNTLPVKKPTSIPKIILEQILNPLIYILIAACAVSFSLKAMKDAFFIFIVILTNTIIGSYQEWKAEKSSKALHNLLKIYIKTKRNEETQTVNAEFLVPGDIVQLESGGKVPADIRILKQTRLMADESLLTGESTPVVKNSEKIEREVPLSDRENMLYAGSMITSGRGLGVVTETGLQTELGKIAETVTSLKKTKPPLMKRMERFSRQISLVVIAACGFIALIEFLRGEAIVDIFFLVVALAVSSIPEGLPAALTVALSVGMSRMAKRNVIIRKLPAVEGLGSCTLIASDKTGTLTVNKQTVKLLYLPNGSKFHVTGEGYTDEGEIKPFKKNYSVSEVEELVKCAVICNEGIMIKKRGKWASQGDAVDIALLALGYKFGLNPQNVKKNSETLKEIPFEPERKFSARFYKHNEKVMVAVKGASEVVLEFCSHMKKNNNLIEIDKKYIEIQLKTLSGTGHRVIALAKGEIASKHDHEYHEEDLKNLTFLGLIGLIDPLRPEAKSAVNTCKKAGIKVIMITGDHPETAYTIGKNLSIVKSRDDVAEGTKLAEIDKSSGEFTAIVNKATVFARVTPLQKLYIVESLIKSGNFIAVTGDGVNDAPALKKAHISVAMGSGTDVAKDVSSIIIVDDNFASIVAGVEEGRYSYDNIRKVIYLLISTGAAEIILFLLAILSNLPAPLVAVQLLWLNLATNGIQGVALAFEKGEKETMEKPPRKPKEGIFNKLMVQETIISGVSMGVIAYTFWVILMTKEVSEFSARNIILVLMVLFENIHAFNCRSEYKSAFKIPIRNNILLVTAVIAAQAIHITFLNIPIMQDTLGLEPIGFKKWLYLLVFSGSILLIMELFKVFRNKSINNKF